MKLVHIDKHFPPDLCRSTTIEMFSMLSIEKENIHLRVKHANLNFYFFDRPAIYKNYEVSVEEFIIILGYEFKYFKKSCLFPKR